MVTPFEDIYPQFLSQITDYGLTVMYKDDREKTLQNWLLGATGFFSNCKHDLSDFDSELKIFNSELNYMEKEILAKFMVLVYLNSHLIVEDLMKQSLNSKDYRMYSPANQIKALIDLKSQINSEANTLMSRYSYNIHRLKDFFKT